MRKEVRSWRELSQGDTVVVLTRDKQCPRFAGKVDVVSSNGSFLWLLLNNGAGRRVFHRQETYTTLLDAETSTASKGSVQLK